MADSYEAEANKAFAGIYSEIERITGAVSSLTLILLNRDIITLPEAKKVSKILFQEVKENDGSYKA